MQEHAAARRAPAQRGRPWLLGGIAVFVAAFGVLVAAGATELEVSADGYGTHPLWLLVAPTFVGLGLVRLLPPRPPDDPDAAVRSALAPRRLGAEAAILLGLVVAFIAVNLAVGRVDDPEDPAALLYPLSKVVLWLVLPLVAFRVLRPGPGAGLGRLVTRPAQGWRWAGMLAVVVVLYLGQLSPLASPLPAADQLPPLEIVVIGALITFLTAGVLEEVVFRVWLQTRLELLLGRWAGIVVASLAFGLMHMVSHQALGSPVLATAQVIALQGTSGLLYGYLWSRYRNVWLVIVLHGGINALGLVVVLLS